jgi:hypothetical protein
MTKFEITDEMLGDAIRAYNRAYCTKDQVWDDAMRAAISAAIEASGLVERIAELERAGKDLTDACHASIRITGIHYTPVISTRFNRAVEAMVEALNKDTTND